MLNTFKQAPAGKWHPCLQHLAFGMALGQIWDWHRGVAIISFLRGIFVVPTAVDLRTEPGKFLCRKRHQMHLKHMWKLKEKLRLPLWVMLTGGEGQEDAAVIRIE